jgi:exopolyphosphatase/guanosine-5'-triphosphate,3'-diphosphate pyrophosphatase
MTTSRLAVIDLGSNTFHLLIVDLQPEGHWIPIVKDRHYVKLASGGLHRIDNESIDRAIRVMKEFALQIREYKVDATYAIGTAALREAENGMEVAKLLEKETGISIEIIDGQEEAQYILKGILSALPPMDSPCLIMDIGGGSVEFILFHRNEILFTRSYKIGVALLFKSFHKHDPISENEIANLTQYLQAELTDLISMLKGIPDYYLVGASGSFEVIQDFMPKRRAEMHWSELEMDGLDEYMTKVIHADLENRKMRDEIPVERLY